jgi:hypothetical protein
METNIPAQVVYNVPHLIPIGYFIAIYFYITEIGRAHV